MSGEILDARERLRLARSTRDAPRPFDSFTEAEWRLAPKADAGDATGLEAVPVVEELAFLVAAA